LSTSPLRRQSHQHQEAGREKGDRQISARPPCSPVVGISGSGPGSKHDKRSRARSDSNESRTGCLEEGIYPSPPASIRSAPSSPFRRSPLTRRSSPRSTGSGGRGGTAVYKAIVSPRVGHFVRAAGNKGPSPRQVREGTERKIAAAAAAAAVAVAAAVKGEASRSGVQDGQGFTAVQLPPLRTR
jgi:hypothetical protein